MQKKRLNKKHATLFSRWDVVCSNSKTALSICVHLLDKNLYHNIEILNIYDFTQHKNEVQLLLCLTAEEIMSKERK